MSVTPSSGALEAFWRVALLTISSPYVPTTCSAVIVTSRWKVSSGPPGFDAAAQTLAMFHCSKEKPPSGSSSTKSVNHPATHVSISHSGCTASKFDAWMLR
jgi:hypothetical protein